MTVPFIEKNDQTEARAQHLKALKDLVGNVYPNKFERSNVTGTVSGEDTITSIVETFKRLEPQVSEGEKPSADALESANHELSKVRVRVAGRIAAPPRVMGKAAFVHLSDGVSRLQIYVRRQDVVGVRNDAGSSTNLSLSDTVDGWELFSLLDHGDFIGVEGYLFVTKTGELSVHVEKLQFLAKALLPMPDKMHGIHDPEIRQRQRYADLIAGSLKLEPGVGSQESGRKELNPRQVFELRARVIKEIRRFLDEHGYIEVETPMLTPLATGAAARPFETYHKALGIPLYARIAPELYLKRLVVGGFEKVYELNRNFRNEGISAKHNPEFTMLEFYWAYADVNQMMDLCEELLRSVVYTVTGHTKIKYGQGDAAKEIDFSKPFQRMTMKQAIIKFWNYELQQTVGIELDPRRIDNASEVKFFADWLADWSYLQPYTTMPGYEPQKIDGGVSQKLTELAEAFRARALSYTLGDKKEDDQHSADRAVRIAYIFEMTAEEHLIQPTFITDFPKPISPLSKASPTDPSVAERFEYFVAGIESANGFSELNDPEEQYQRFKDQEQQRKRGDEEAMVMDEDYIRALSYGMPPAAGIGVGIDRLVMLLANKHSIRDVILFPHLRPERAEGSRQEAEGTLEK